MRVSIARAMVTRPRIPLMHEPLAALLICAWMVAFFPIRSGTVIGLRSTDHNLRELFTLYCAMPWQRLRFLLTTWASRRVLGYWHESEIRREH